MLKRALDIRPKLPCENPFGFVLSDNFISEGSQKHIRQGRSLDFSKGGGVTLCHTQGTYQIVLSTSMLCFTKSDIFSDEQ